MKYDYDLFVIGGGSGGVRTARKAAMLGQSVAIAEHSRFGGTCVVRGCIPKKLYFYAAQYHNHFQQAKFFGWQIKEKTFNWQRLVANKEKEITRLEKLYLSNLQKAGVTIFNETATLHSPQEIKIGNKIFSAKKIIIATGGSPNKMLELQGHQHCIVSDHAFDLPELPKNIIIYGGGYIAVEFAGIFNALGVKTTLVYRGNKILRGFDETLQNELTNAYKNDGIEIITNREIEKIELQNNKRQVFLLGGEKLQSDMVLLATGRRPASDNMGLKKIGVKYDEKNYIKVNDYCQTNIDSIFAIGDVTNNIQLTPVAIHEAMCFVETQYGGQKIRPDYELVASAVYSHPEIGTVGPSEYEAQKKYKDLDIFIAKFRPLCLTLTDSHETIVMKIIVDAKTQKVLACHIIGRGGDELIQALAIAIKMGAKKSDFDATMAVHPTSAEELVTMYEASYKIRDGQKIE